MTKTSQALIKLLGMFPGTELVSATNQDGLMGWMLVRLSHSFEYEPGTTRLKLLDFSIWKHTGAIHRMEGGEVIDPPLLTLE